ncbi:hypothetical protein Emag_000688 [Eimeria magna]
MAPPSIRRALALGLLASAACTYPAFAAEDSQIGTPGIEEQLVTPEAASALQREDASVGATPATGGSTSTAKVAALGFSVAALLAAAGAFLALRFLGPASLGDLKPEEYHQRAIEALLEKKFYFSFNVNNTHVTVKVPETEMFSAFVNALTAENAEKAKSAMAAELKSRVDVAAIQGSGPTTVAVNTPVGPVALVFEVSEKPAPPKEEENKEGEQKKAE